MDSDRRLLYVNPVGSTESKGDHYCPFVLSPKRQCGKDPGVS